MERIGFHHKIFIIFHFRSEISIRMPNWKGKFVLRERKFIKSYLDENQIIYLTLNDLLVEGLCLNYVKTKIKFFNVKNYKISLKV
jgi:hypothetical protein